jgi:hypothetical protein
MSAPSPYGSAPGQITADGNIVTNQPGLALRSGHIMIKELFVWAAERHGWVRLRSAGDGIVIVGRDGAWPSTVPL